MLTFHAARELLPPALARAIVRRIGARWAARDPPAWARSWPMALPPALHALLFSRLDLSGYDLVISSSHACAINVRPPEGAIHVCYCYTPMRYAWLPETERERTVGGAAGLALRGVRAWLRRVDLAASRRPSLYMGISEAVVERIRRFYGREARVVHPPVELADLRSDGEKEPGHFLWVHRLVPYKRPLLVAEAFRGLPYRLTMVGVGPLEGQLRASLPPNVELLGWLSRERLAQLYAQASGFIHLGEEDFGIAMVEALGSGTPVIALNRGGARDIVRDGLDGLLLERPDAALLRAAVERVASMDWDRSALVARAAQFSTERFLERFGACLESALAGGA